MAAVDGLCERLVWRAVPCQWMRCNQYRIERSVWQRTVAAAAASCSGLSILSRPEPMMLKPPWLRKGACRSLHRRSFPTAHGELARRPSLMETAVCPASLTALLTA
jgi:hypothetical protein